MTTAFPRTNRRWLWVLVGAVIVIALLVPATILWLPNPSNGPAGTIVSIPRGASFHVALDSLDAAGAIRFRWTFSLAARILALDTKIHVGRYLFRPGMTNQELLEDLSKGASRKLESVTVPEGWRMESIARKFGRVLGIDSAKFARLCRDPQFIRKLGVDAPTLEGYLLPDTYEFYWQTDEEEVVRAMVGSFQTFYADSLHKRQQQLGLSMSQLLALASIVEGETGIGVERPIIAGVYWNRLRKRMKLEADPTIQYVLPNGPRRLTYDDLRIDSPYNTYRNYGLPPGPINNPGRDAIVAALYPSDHRYLFFVATGTGGHRFSATYAEHLRNVQSFRKVRRAQQQAPSTHAS